MNKNYKMKSVSPIISCIIPVYNAEKYLERCLNSLLCQTYPSIELVLVDDGSTDESGQICDEYAARYSTIKVCHVVNGGASQARKKGLELSTGEYVVFVDSDDYVSEDYIGILYDLIVKYEVTVSACNVQRVYIGETASGIVSAAETQEDVLLGFKRLMPRFFKYEFWGFWGKLYRRNVFDGLYFPKATLSEDYAIMAQLFDRERKMAYTNRPLYYYEYHAESLSHQKLSERAFEEFENVRYVYDYVCRNFAEYGGYALANVVETAVKLSFMMVEDHKHEFQFYFQEIYQFLCSHRSRILRCVELASGVKVLALGMSFSTRLTIAFYKMLKRG